ncbi:MAG: tetratricopeptide repeat protein [Elusimicrobia bacterium]|nr:tetratricopeptide repeat protein [Elusimicrobiota bacterium]
MEAQRQADASRYVRDARMSADRRYSVQKEQRDRVAQAAKLISKDELLRASDVLNRVLEEAPGLDEARDQMGRLDRRLTARLNRRFPSAQHQAAHEGIYQYNQSQWDAAGRSLRLALDAGPLPDDLVSARLEDYAALADKKAAEDLWRRERQDLLAGAQRAEQEGDLNRARLNLEKVLARDPADPQARAALSNLGAVTTAVKKAVREEARLKEVPRLLSKATLDMVNERYTEALETLNQVLEIDPTNAGAIEQVGEVKRLMQGRKLYVPPVQIKTSAEERYREGLRLYGDEKYDDARAAFEEALRLDPKHEEARQALRRIKERENKGAAK